MNKRNNIIIGGIFVAMGLLFMLSNLNIVNIYFDIFDIGFLIGHFWPSLFLILPSIAMHSSFFSGKNREAGILVPAGILMTFGVAFQLCMLFNLWGFLWPFYSFFPVAVGLFELYCFGNRNRGLLIPVGILGGLTVIFSMDALNNFIGLNLGNIVVPAGLILLGVLILNKGKKDKGGF